MEAIQKAIDQFNYRCKENVSLHPNPCHPSLFEAQEALILCTFQRSDINLQEQLQNLLIDKNAVHEVLLFFEQLVNNGPISSNFALLHTILQFLANTAYTDDGRKCILEYPNALSLIIKSLEDFFLLISDSHALVAFSAGITALANCCFNDKQTQDQAAGFGGVELLCKVLFIRMPWSCLIRVAKTLAVITFSSNIAQIAALPKSSTQAIDEESSSSNALSGLDELISRAMVSSSSASSSSNLTSFFEEATLSKNTIVSASAMILYSLLPAVVSATAWISTLKKTIDLLPDSVGDKIPLVEETLRRAELQFGYDTCDPVQYAFVSKRWSIPSMPKDIDEDDEHDEQDMVTSSSSSNPLIELSAKYPLENTYIAQVCRAGIHPTKATWFVRQAMSTDMLRTEPIWWSAAALLKDYLSVHEIADRLPESLEPLRGRILTDDAVNQLQMVARDFPWLYLEDDVAYFFTCHAKDRLLAWTDPS